MFDFLQSAVAQAMLWLAVLVFLVGVAVYGVRKLREGIDNNEANASELLSKFRDLHQEGDLSDAEFRTIKTALGAKLQRQLKNKTSDD